MKGSTWLVDVSHVTLDAGRHAYGGLLVNHTMDLNIGPAIMIVGYTGAGISLPGSGATFVQHAWLGAIAPGSPLRGIASAVTWQRQRAGNPTATTPCHPHQGLSVGRLQGCTRR